MSNTFDSKHTLRYGGSYPGNSEVSCIDDPDISELTYTKDSMIVFLWLTRIAVAAQEIFVLQWGFPGRPCDASALLLNAANLGDCSWELPSGGSCVNIPSPGYFCSNSTCLDGILNAGTCEVFFAAAQFTSDLAEWDVARVTDMTGMFANTARFNSNLGAWDVTSVATTRRMFFAATTFNQDLSLWSVARVNDMNRMFEGAWSFNKSLPLWDVAKVLDFRFVFLMQRSSTRIFQSGTL